jgi:hypothetical protein
MTDARTRIRELRAEGHGWRAVANRLNAEGIDTPSGRGQWYDTTAAHHHDPRSWSTYMNAYRSRTRSAP